MGLFHQPPKVPSRCFAFHPRQLLWVTTVLPLLEFHIHGTIQTEAFCIYLSPIAQSFSGPCCSTYEECVPFLFLFWRTYYVRYMSGIFSCIISPGVLTTILLHSGATPGSGSPAVESGEGPQADSRVSQPGGSAHRAPEPDLWHLLSSSRGQMGPGLAQARARQLGT